jgi:hypothetical protein
MSTQIWRKGTARGGKKERKKKKRKKILAGEDVR